MSRQKSNTLELIARSPLNTSKSKAMFSFTKANRFIETKENRSTTFYDKPSMLHLRSTSFGYGTKSQLINKYQNSPSPDKYNHKSDFQVSPKKGLSIGLGRQDCKNVSIFSMHSTKNPSPTDYKYQQKQNKNAYSMRAKLKLPQLFPDRKVPAPGQYITQNIQKNGVTFNSKYKSNICFKINDESPNKPQKQLFSILGPCSYNTILPSTGKQIMSKKITQKSFYFDKKPRVTMHTDTIAPGPGAYNFFSQFNR